MQLGLHTYANGDIYLKLAPENKTEKDLIDFFFGSCEQTKHEAIAGSLNGIFIKTGKTLKH